MFIPTTRTHNDRVEAKLAEDRSIFGSSYHTVDADGNMHRIHPMNIRRNDKKDDSYSLRAEGTDLTTKDIIVTK